MLGLGAVVATGLQGGETDRVLDLARRARLAAHPLDLGFDEPTFNGILRHTVRYAVGEDLSHSVFHTADVNISTAKRLWSALWSLPRRE